MRRLALVLVCLVSAAAGVACDPCSAVAVVHVDRCNSGEQASCDWLAEHEYSGGVCG